MEEANRYQHELKISFFLLFFVVAFVFCDCFMLVLLLMFFFSFSFIFCALTFQSQEYIKIYKERNERNVNDFSLS